MTIKVEKSKVLQSISQMETIRSKLKNVEASIGNVDAGIDAQSAAMDYMRRRLADIRDDLGDQIRKFAAMEDGLERALEYYFGCENRITGNGEASEKALDLNSGSGILGDISGFFSGIVEWLEDLFVEWGWLESDREKELKKDRAMASSIASMLTQERYSEEYWKKAGYEEREQILTELYNELNEIMGIHVEEILFKDIEDEPGYITYGYLSHWTGNDQTHMTMTLNKKILQDPDGYRQAIDTLCHEMRHGYQHSVVENPDNYIVSEEMANAWRNNFNDYKTTEDDGYDAYRNQIVESDARNFAFKVLAYMENMPDRSQLE